MERINKAVAIAALGVGVSTGAFLIEQESRDDARQASIECFDKFDGTEESACVAEVRNSGQSHINDFKILGMVAALAGGVQVYRRLEDQRKGALEQRKVELDYQKDLNNIRKSL